MNERLEELSDKVRQGEPIAMSEAFEVIEYQEKLRIEREARRSKSLLWRFVRWIRRT